MCNLGFLCWHRPVDPPTALIYSWTGYGLCRWTRLLALWIKKKLQKETKIEKTSKGFWGPLIFHVCIINIHIFMCFEVCKTNSTDATFPDLTDMGLEQMIHHFIRLWDKKEKKTTKTYPMTFFVVGPSKTLEILRHLKIFTLILMSKLALLCLFCVFSDCIKKKNVTQVFCPSGSMLELPEKITSQANNIYKMFFVFTAQISILTYSSRCW